MRLRDVALRTVKARKKAFRLSDGAGLYLLVHSNGGKYWQFRYKRSGREKVFSLGVYPEITLKEAREGRDRARKFLREGKDPCAERQIAKLHTQADGLNNFESVALEWHIKRKAIWTSRHAKLTLRRLEKDIFPALGQLPIAQIRPRELLSVLQRIENRNAIDAAHRMQQIVGQIFRYAVACGKVERDITTDLRGALQPARKKNYARLSANELPEFLRKVEVYDGERQTKIALKLLLLTFVRTVELRGAVWSEIDLEKAEWRIPSERMKMRAEHIVPLSRQAVELLTLQRQLSWNHEHVFPNRNKPRTFISENTILFAIYRMGYHSRTTAHGFRGMASTILHESGFDSEIIERQLAHGDRNAVRAAYNHATYLPQRREMMQWWADYLDKATSQEENRSSDSAQGLK